MAWLFFIDESGHDHRTTPYEVRGGIAMHVSQLWQFVREIQRLEAHCFGCRLHDYGKEIKGSTLVDRKRFALAAQDEILPGDDPRGVIKPPHYRFNDYLRKDVVFLLERFFYFLEEKREHGVLVMDETDKREDRRFVARVERYFTKTATGRERTTWIVPTPFFVSSDTAYAVQAADLCIYCVNWGFRLPNRGMNAERRDQIATMFGVALADLQYRGQGYRDGRVFDTYGVVYVPDPYEPRTGA